MAASPIYSAGARYERAMLRKYLERKIKAYGTGSSYAVLLSWLRGRQSRYDRRPGGL